MKIERDNYLRLRSYFADRFIEDLSSYQKTGYKNVHADNLLDDFQSFFQTISSFKDYKAMHQIINAREFLHNGNIPNGINEIKKLKETNVVGQPQSQK